MTTFDKSLYLQRLLYAVEHAAKFDGATDDSTLWNYRHTLAEADKELDNAILSITYALELKGFFPRITEIGD